MKRKQLCASVVAILLAVATLNDSALATVQTTAFTYQGQLNAGGSLGNGMYQFTFTLYDAPTAGNVIGAPVQQAIQVIGGLFTTDLDFGKIFNGTQYWLEIKVGTTIGSQQALSARQPVNAVPVAQFALSGNPGPAGPPGYKSLIAQAAEQPGPNCAVGGTRITSGLDTNGNGVLDPPEITATSYVCNISSKPIPPPGCTAMPLTWAYPPITFTVPYPSVSANIGDVVVFSAHSVDPNSCPNGTPPLTPNTYSWSLLSTPPGSKASLAGTTDAQPALVPDVYGSYVIRGIVTDAIYNQTPPAFLEIVTSLCGSNHVNVTVQINPGPQPTDPVFLTALAQTDDNNNATCPARFQTIFTSFSWTVVSAPFSSTWQFSSPTLNTTYFQHSAAGVYGIQVTVHDSNNGTGFGTLFVTF